MNDYCGAGNFQKVQQYETKNDGTGLELFCKLQRDRWTRKIDSRDTFSALSISVSACRTGYAPCAIKQRIQYFMIQNRQIDSIRNS